MNQFRFLIPIGLFLLSLCYGCSSGQAVVTDKGEGMPNESVYERAIGSWTGTIPCADCPGIDYALDLNIDSTYRERLVYQGRSATPFVQSGTWSVSNGKVRLNKEGTGNNQFTIEGENLVMLDRDGNRIESAHADAYRLRRQNPNEPEDNPRLWREKYERGIDFAANGNEPFWSLEIDLEKMIEFKALDEENGRVITPVPVAEKPETGEGLVYKVQTVSGDLEIRLLKEPCVNTMSGRELPYTVTVLKDDMEYMGCGMYLRDSRLEGTWKLVNLQGKAINPKELQGEQPHLVFSLAEGRVSGNAGCNRINGTVEPRGYKFFFGAIAATRMACPNMGVEQQLLEILNSKELEYKVDDAKLELKAGGKVVAVFTRGE